MIMNLTPRQQKIIDIVDAQGQASISRVKELLSSDPSIPTLNRDMAKLVEANYLKKLGAGRCYQKINMYSNQQLGMY